MEKIECKECGNEIEQTEGKKKKEYCGNTCRVKYWQKKKRQNEPPKKRGRKPKTEIAIPEPNEPVIEILPTGDKMPENLDWKEQLEWNRLNKKH